MLKFAIIAEGKSDQYVIENILHGFFQEIEDELVVTYTQPPQSTDDPDAFGGWNQVFETLQRGRAQEALQFNDFVVIHIDTDKQEDVGFDVPRTEKGVELTIPTRVERVIARLVKEVGESYIAKYGPSFLFAIAVDSIECWLLPLLYNDKKAAKTTGCLEAANKKLRKGDKQGLSSSEEKKFPEAYKPASKDFRKRKTLMKVHDKNPSLELFIQQLVELEKRLTPSQEQGEPQEPERKPDSETLVPETPPEESE